MKQDIEIRRRLINMSTHDIVVIGVLTVRFFKNRTYNRWQIDSPGLRTSIIYKVYPAADYTFGEVDQIGARNKALTKATAYILANYQGERIA